MSAERTAAAITPVATAIAWLAWGLILWPSAPHAPEHAATRAGLSVAAVYFWFVAAAMPAGLFAIAGAQAVAAFRRPRVVTQPRSSSTTV